MCCTKLKHLALSVVTVDTHVKVLLQATKTRQWPVNKASYMHFQKHSTMELNLKLTNSICPKGVTEGGWHNICSLWCICVGRNLDFKAKREQSK